MAALDAEAPPGTAAVERGAHAAAPPRGHPIHMVRAHLDVTAFQRWAGGRGLISRSAFDEGFAMHCLLVESFGELAPQPFRIIVPRDRQRLPGVLYGYAQAPADDLREAAAAFACPLQASVLPAAQIQSKPMPSAWEPGRQLGFEVLTRPIRRRRQSQPAAAAAPAPITERDAFQVEAERHPPGGMTRSREEVYRDWLAERFERGGARLDQARLTSFQRVRTVRKLRARASEGPRALMQGTLTITHPARFASLLARGVGRHRAYGYGMLLLRPPARRPHAR